jgi:dienelactone hydrolase
MVRIRAFVLALAVVVASFAHEADAATVGIAWEPLTLPVTIAGKAYRLDAMLAYPDDTVRHPLVVLSHGSPRSGDDRPGVRPTANVEDVQWFVRHGFAVASVVRRGYGRSTGEWAEAYGSCSDADYASAGLRGAADIAASIPILRRNAHVDGRRVVAVGVSAGAFATVALTTIAPQGLVAAIAFAPGRGSYAPDKVCDEAKLAEAFAQYGKGSRVPLLWISAANDHFFDPALTARLRAAFASTGGHATFFAAPAVATEGHYLFSETAGIAIWQRPVAAFLTANALALRDDTLADDATDVPAMLGPNGKAAFARYLLQPPHRAFAASKNGFYGYTSGEDTHEAAAAKALAACKRGAGAMPCTVVDDGS